MHVSLCGQIAKSSDFAGICQNLSEYLYKNHRFLSTYTYMYLIGTNRQMVYSPDRSKVVVPVLVLLFGALWFILRGDLLYVLLCAILFLCFSVLLALRLPRLGKRELILVLFVRLIDFSLFGFVGFFFLLVSGKGCGL